jgi:hypothetical protein
MAYSRDGVPFGLETEDRSFFGAPINTGVPVLDQDIQLMHRINADRVFKLYEGMFTAGWMNISQPDSQVDFTSRGVDTLELPSGTFVFNGIPIAFDGAFTEFNRVDLLSTTDSVTPHTDDLIFLEFWMEEVRENDTIYMLGNTDWWSTNHTNDIVDPQIGDPAATRIQLRYRTRIVADASAMDDATILAQGKKATPDPAASFTYDAENHIWFYTDVAVGTFDDVDKTIYATPICLVERTLGDDDVANGTITDLREVLRHKVTAFVPSSESGICAYEFDAQIYTPQADTVLPTTTAEISWCLGNAHHIDMQNATGDVTLTLSNPKPGAAYVIKITQGAGLYQIDWPGNINWLVGATFELTDVDDDVDLVTLYYDGTTYHAQGIGKFGGSAPCLPLPVIVTTTTIEIDFKQCHSWIVDLTNAPALPDVVLNNPAPGAAYSVEFIQGPTTPVEVTWPVSVRWLNGSPHQLTNQPDGKDLIALFYDGTEFLAQGIGTESGECQTAAVPTTTDLTLDLALCESAVVDLGSAPGNIDLILANPEIGGIYTILTIQGNPAREIIWPGIVDWFAGTPFELSTVEDDIDMIILYYDGVNFRAGGVGAVSFKALTDSPNSYTGQARRLVQVNPTESGVEFTDTISITGAQNKIRFNYPNQAAFPSPIVYEGMIAHSEADAAIYFADSGVWKKLGVASGSPLATTDLNDVSGTLPTTGQVFRFNGSVWIPYTLSLDDLSDVDVGTDDGDFLRYNSGTSKWEDAKATVSDMTDVDTSGVAPNDTLYWNGSSWIPTDVSSLLPTASIDDFSDVDISGVSPGDHLEWNGSTWVPVAPPGGGVLTIEDEGIPIAGGPHTTLDFVGTGVTVTNGGGGTATITIAGGAAPVDSVSGSGGGINVTPTTGAVVVQNTGVHSVTAGTNVTLGGTANDPIINVSGTLPSWSASLPSFGPPLPSGPPVPVLSLPTTTIAGVPVLVQGKLDIGNIFSPDIITLDLKRGTTIIDTQTFRLSNPTSAVVRTVMVTFDIDPTPGANQTYSLEVTTTGVANTADNIKLIAMQLST